MGKFNAPIMSLVNFKSFIHHLHHMLLFITILPSTSTESSSSSVHPTTTPLPTGHLQPLGSHRPPDVIIDELNEVPSPRDFWEKYVKHEKAVIFRGAAKESPAFKLWTDEYLREQYGNLEVRFHYIRYIQTQYVQL